MAAGCKLAGGSWRSAYDGLQVTDAARLEVDHFVPLAEVFDSEQTLWSAARREAYANDQDSPDTLIAVSDASNRSKSDKDPAQRLPANTSYHCAYAPTWVATKLRWDLTADDAEQQTLQTLATQCPATTVAYEPALWPGTRTWSDVRGGARPRTPGERPWSCTPAGSGAVPTRATFSQRGQHTRTAHEDRLEEVVLRGSRNRPCVEIGLIGSASQAPKAPTG
ncbi:HNH endonuclease family protein [Streptomyces sp. NPDC050264]|uniref:HNH endonuclease family protein n=1 Tax=Streptomyces sp. NPDC050264 TaxID=3155038 RepID=UPI0034263DF0